MHTAVTRVRTAVGESLPEDAVIAAEEAIISEGISKIRFGDGKYNILSRQLNDYATTLIRTYQRRWTGCVRSWALDPSWQFSHFG